MKALSLNESLIAIEASNRSVRSDAVTFLKSLKAIPELGLRVQEADFSVGTRKFKHFACSLNGPDGEQVYGHGRSQRPQVALTKSVFEVIERLTMRNVELNKSEHSICAVWNENGGLGGLAPNMTVQNNERVPTSNGWAAANNAKVAIMSALREAVERHSLQKNYWLRRLAGLSYRGHYDLGWDQLSLWCLPSEFSGLTTLVSAYESRQFSGLCFGHKCVEGDFVPFFDSKNFEYWEHVMLEAVQAFEVVRLGQDAPSSSIFERVERCFAFDSEIRKSLMNSSGTFAARKVELQFCFKLFDVSNLVGLSNGDAPVFVAQVWSEQLLPLYLGDRLSEIEKSWFDLHPQLVDAPKPLVQTPFV